MQTGETLAKIAHFIAFAIVVAWHLACFVGLEKSVVADAVFATCDIAKTMSDII